MTNQRRRGLWAFLRWVYGAFHTPEKLALQRSIDHLNTVCDRYEMSSRETHRITREIADGF